MQKTKVWQTKATSQFDGCVLRRSHLLGAYAIKVFLFQDYFRKGIVAFQGKHKRMSMLIRTTSTIICSQNKQWCWFTFTALRFHTFIGFWQNLTHNALDFFHSFLAYFHFFISVAYNSLHGQLKDVVCQTFLHSLKMANLLK